MLPTSNTDPNYPALVPRVVPLLEGRSPAAKPRPLALAAAPDVSALLKALRRRWTLALVLGPLCAAAAAAAAWSVLPSSKYTTRAILHIASYPPRVIFNTSDNEHRDREEFETFKRTQVDLIKSRLVLNSALSQPRVAELAVIRQQADPVEWLETELQLERSEGSEIVRIVLSGRDPRDTATVVNAVAEAYLKEVVNANRMARVERYNMLKDLWNTYQTTLKAKRETLKALSEAAGSNDKQTLALKHQLKIERLGMAEKELMQLQSELRRAQVEANLLQKDREKEARAERPSISAAMIEDALARDPRAQQFAARIAKLRIDMNRISGLTRSKADPALVGRDRELQATLRELEVLRQRLRPVIVEQLQTEVGVGGSPRPVLATMLERIAMLKELEKSLGEDVKRLTDATNTFGHTTSDLEAAQEEISHAEAATQRIGTEVESLNVEMAAPPRVRLIENAAIPRTKDSKQIKMSGMAAIGAFALVLLSISWLEFRAGRIDAVEEVVNGLGIRLMGTLPPLAERMRGRANKARDHQWQNLLVEAVDATRTALLHAAETESFRLVMVASALGGEGKTSLACHLATSLARAGRRTLLVDCDLRNPSIHQLFEVEPAPGFSELLRGDSRSDEVIRPTAASGLWVLPAGASDLRAIQLLAQDGVRSIFDELRGRFDYVVIDSSPILPVVDSLLIGQHADAVVFSILREVSRLPKVHAAYERLEMLGVRMIGAVVAGVNQPDIAVYGSRYSHPMNSSG